LVIGDLATTSTSSGLRAVAYAVLPRLVEQFGDSGFELRLVGGGAPPPDLAPALEHPSVRFVGRVVPADPEFLATDLMVVPTNIPLGIRVRVVTAWSFGCPIVAHRANASGVPEMQEGDNSLLADTDAQLADAVSRALEDEALRRRLSQGGRRTFEKWFSESIAGQAIVDEMEKVAAVRDEEQRRGSSSRPLKSTKEKG
jgi:glycosyltransferase involved in cell wall biosynthesis